MIYELEISEQADNDLRGMNILPLNYNLLKTQADSLTVWKNRY